MDELQRRILQLLDSAPHAKKELYSLGDAAEVDTALEALIVARFVRRTGKSRWTVYARTKKAAPAGEKKSESKPVAALTADRRIVLAYIDENGTGKASVITSEFVTEIDHLLKKAA